ncbi:MAG: HdeD family acid-resistance protein [Solirubrobacteraceae bacterium]
MASQAFAGRNSAPDVETPGWAWWLLLLVAVCTFAVGVLLLFWPHRTLSTLAVIVGIYLLVVGAIWVGVSLGVKEVRGVGLWRGVLALLAGVILVRHPSDSITVLALAFGIFLLLAGVFELVAAIEIPERRGWRILEGLVDLAIGVLIVSWPQFGVYTFAIVIGISLIVRGAVEACLAVAGIAVSRGERHGHTDLSVA